MKFIIVLLLVFLTACSGNTKEKERFNEVFIDLFDTIIILQGYAYSQEEFSYFSREVVRPELLRLHRLFDIYNEYAGLNNISTINNNAGIRPVEVDPVLIELLKFCVEAYSHTNGAMNVALGPVLAIWHEYRALANETLDTPPELPSMEALQAAFSLSNINDIIINEENNTVFLRHEGMSLNVGGIAKGFSMERAANAATAAGFLHFTLSVGGDVRTALGPPGSETGTWSVGLQDPDNLGNIFYIVHVGETSVFSSGDYQRYFYADGVRFHHIIDPQTLMPASLFRSVTVIYPDAGLADVLSTAAFIMGFDEGRALMERFGAEAVWYFYDGTLDFLWKE